MTSTGVLIGWWVAATLVIALSANLAQPDRPATRAGAQDLQRARDRAPASCSRSTWRASTSHTRSALGVAWAGADTAVTVVCMLIVLLGPVLAVWRYDLGERGMLGDAGSNAMGAIVGYLLAGSLASADARGGRRRAPWPERALRARVVQRGHRGDTAAAVSGPARSPARGGRWCDKRRRRAARRPARVRYDSQEHGRQREDWGKQYGKAHLRDWWRRLRAWEGDHRGIARPAAQGTRASRSRSRSSTRISTSIPGR